jgi:hypothetical protein
MFSAGVFLAVQRFYSHSPVIKRSKLVTVRERRTHSPGQRRVMHRITIEGPWLEACQVAA